MDFGFLVSSSIVLHFPSIWAKAMELHNNAKAKIEFFMIKSIKYLQRKYRNKS